MNQVNIGQRIKQRREAIGLSMQDVADKLDVNRSSVMRWENGETNKIKLPIVEKLAQILQTSPDYLMGYREAEKQNEGPVCTKQDVCFLPVLRSLVPEEDLFNQENMSGYELAPGLCRQGVYFYAQVFDTSMAPCLAERDLVLIKKQSSLKSGALGVFVINEENWVLREFVRRGETVILRAFNPYYPAMEFSQAESESVRIVGRVTESKHRG